MQVYHFFSHSSDVVVGHFFSSFHFFTLMQCLLLSTLHLPLKGIYIYLTVIRYVMFPPEPVFGSLCEYCNLVKW